MIAARERLAWRGAVCGFTAAWERQAPRRRTLIHRHDGNSVLMT
jgi:hypothetical protein